MENRTNFRILIVDDELLFHQTIRHAFQENYEFEGAVSVEKMWGKLKQDQHFDLLLLDLRLEGTEENIGLELIPKLKEKYPSIPVIVATKESDSGAIIAAMEAGAKSYLIKGDYNKAKWDQKFQEFINMQKSQQLAVENKELKKEIKRMSEQEEDEKYKFVGQSKKVLEIKTLLAGLAKEPNARGWSSCWVFRNYRPERCFVK